MNHARIPLQPEEAQQHPHASSTSQSSHALLYTTHPPPPPYNPPIHSPSTESDGTNSSDITKYLDLSQFESTAQSSKAPQQHQKGKGQAQLSSMEALHQPPLHWYSTASGLPEQFRYQPGPSSSHPIISRKRHVRILPQHIPLPHPLSASGKAPKRPRRKRRKGKSVLEREESLANLLNSGNRNVPCWSILTPLKKTQVLNILREQVDMTGKRKNVLWERASKHLTLNMVDNLTSEDPSKVALAIEDFNSQSSDSTKPWAVGLLPPEKNIIISKLAMALRTSIYHSEIILSRKGTAKVAKEILDAESENVLRIAENNGVVEDVMSHQDRSNSISHQLHEWSTIPDYKILPKKEKSLILNLLTEASDMSKVSLGRKAPKLITPMIIEQVLSGDPEQIERARKQVRLGFEASGQIPEPWEEGLHPEEKQLIITKAAEAIQRKHVYASHLLNERISSQVARQILQADQAEMANIVAKYFKIRGYTRKSRMI